MFFLKKYLKKFFNDLSVVIFQNKVKKKITRMQRNLLIFGFALCAKKKNWGKEKKFEQE